VSRNRVNRHKLQNNMTKHTRPAIEQTFARLFGQDTVERVKKPCWTKPLRGR